MKNEKTIVVIGGGYAGVNLIEALKKKFHTELKAGTYKVILIDKNEFHFKKVKLFKGIVAENVSDLYVPLKEFGGIGIEFIQGKLIAINHEKQTLQITSNDGVLIHQKYDKLVLAVGSVLKHVDSECGGLALTSLENAKEIRAHILKKLESTKGKFRMGIVGSGITGIETAAEVRSWIKDEAGKKGIQEKNIEIYLINNKERILNEAPQKISMKLENRLNKHGIRLVHNKRAEKFIDHKVHFSDNTELEVELCIWTVGLLPNPILTKLDLPLNNEGKVKVDSWYRLVESENIYAIGDCVHIVDSISGKTAGMSCKEAISQAKQLAEIIKSDFERYTATPHTNYGDLVCIGLGPRDGFVWAQKWGADFIIQGKVAERIREYTWNIASQNH